MSDERQGIGQEEFRTHGGGSQEIGGSRGLKSNDATDISVVNRRFVRGRQFFSRPRLGSPTPLLLFVQHQNLRGVYIRTSQPLAQNLCRKRLTSMGRMCNADQENAKASRKRSIRNPDAVVRPAEHGGRFVPSREMLPPLRGPRSRSPAMVRKPPAGGYS